MSNVLFVCVHNAGRSQMASAIFNAAARERGLAQRAISAGTVPAGRVHPNVAEAMRELDIDLGGAVPRLITDDMIRSAGRVVTMGCAIDAEACPAVFLRDVEDWSLPDPKDQGVDGARDVRDEIRRRVDRLLDTFS